jgi:hypothetical protein
MSHQIKKNFSKSDFLNDESIRWLENKTSFKQYRRNRYQKGMGELTKHIKIISI